MHFAKNVISDNYAFKSGQLRGMWVGWLALAVARWERTLVGVFFIVRKNAASQQFGTRDQTDLFELWSRYRYTLKLRAVAWVSSRIVRNQEMH